MSQVHSTRFRLAAGLLLAATAVGGCGRIRTETRNKIPERYPLGSVNRAHYHTMQANSEATDFIFNLNEFVGETAELSPDAKDHILEVGARMRSAPFPVIVERSWNNANPELDAERRNVIARTLADLGNGDADQRTFVATPYDRGLNSFEGEIDYYRNFGMRGTTFGNGNGNGGFGGFGGGGGGGGGFGF